MFKRWLYIEEIIKLCREDKVCWNSVKTEIWGITGELIRVLISKDFPSFLLTPFFPTLHWLPSPPSQYTCSLVETIILHMRSSRIRPGFLRERKCYFWIHISPVFHSFYLNGAQPLPKICTEGNYALEGVYYIEVEEGRRNCCSYKRWSILSSRAHLHNNGKSFPHYSEDGQLKPAQRGQDPVNGLYGWLSHKDVYYWAKRLRLFLSRNRVRRLWILRSPWWLWTSLITFRWWICVWCWGWYYILR